VSEDRVRLLLGELEDRDVAQHRPVEVTVERERADPPRADEPVAVEQHAPPVSDPLERFRREVVAQERRDVHPLDPAQPAFRLVALAPRLPDRLDTHFTVPVGVVVEREGRRLAGSREGHREAQCCQASQVRAPLGLAALRDDDRLLLQAMQRPCCVPGTAADLIGASAYGVTRQRADHGERSHDPQA